MASLVVQGVFLGLQPQKYFAGCRRQKKRLDFQSLAIFTAEREVYEPIIRKILIAKAITISKCRVVTIQ